MANSKTYSEHLTIMMIDLCGYTALSHKLSRATLHELHDLFDDISIPTINNFHGTVIKKIGDAFLATFKSPTNALHCAVNLQNKFKNYNKINKPKYPLEIRVALHTGEVIIKDNDIYGDAVNITARIEGITERGQICFSNSLFSAMNKREIPAVYLGRRRFKGVAYPVKIFMVRPRVSRRRENWNMAKDIAWLAVVFALLYLLFRVALRIF